MKVQQEQHSYLQLPLDSFLVPGRRVLLDSTKNQVPVLRDLGPLQDRRQDPDVAAVQGS